MKYKKKQSIGTLFFSPNIDENAVEMIPLLNLDESEEQEDIHATLLEKLPILPIKNTVLFPSVVIPITVTRKKSIRLVKKSYDQEKLIGVIAQENKAIEDPEEDDLYKVGTIARILKMLVLPDGNITIIIQGRQRFEVESFLQTKPYMIAKVQTLNENFPFYKTDEAKALVHSLKESASKILSLNPDIPQEAQVALDNIDNAPFLTHFLSANINTGVPEKQELLEISDGVERVTRLLELMQKDIQLLEIKRDIQDKVYSDIDQQQRDYFLRQQIKVLQDELGDYSSTDQQLQELKIKAKNKQWSPETEKHFQKELDKISRMNPMAAEYPVAVNYVELLVELPWNEYTEDFPDLQRAQKILDQEHYGLDKVKERIIEYLAVLQLKKDMKGPILCFYGPPGVGKTSLGKSIAKSLNRKYIRFSLGGLHDEAEIRGHRKTYVGAMPGKIIQHLKKAGSANPVIVLDEIDKVSSDMRGDPASALLEVLDPEQNNSFVDNYLELPFDLSKVLFIATANSLDTIHPALRDRMEIIEINGYTLEEKIEIAKKHLIPKQRKEHGLQAKHFKMQPKAIQKVIEHYTRESGVRNLERKIGSLARKIAKSVALSEEYDALLKEQDIPTFLGVEIFDRELYEEEKVAGLVIGLAWTQVGGEILFIESSLSKGRGKITLSGHLGNVMKESASTALSYLKANAHILGINYKIFDQYDLHIHVPAGAVPKDGPSAGIAMLTSLASVFTQRLVKPKLAMTGEITLRGSVLPVGGIKEKILAAKRAGIEEVILCIKNRKDIEEINPAYVKDLKIHYVKYAQEVLNLALTDQKATHAIDFPEA